LGCTHENRECERRKKMVEFGPIQLIAIGFPEVKYLKGELLREIFSLSEKKIIRIVGLLAIAKDEKGKMASVQLTELSDDDRIKLGAGIGALIGYGAAGEEGAKAGANAGAEAMYYKEFGLDKKQIKEIAKNIPNETAAGFLLIEHLWAKKFKEIAMKQHGVLLANGFITLDSLVALGASLAEGAKAGENLKLK
jgi:uncharacterized membrane protein